MFVRRRKVRREISWTSSLVGILKFNLDGASRGKPRPTGMGGVLHNSKGEILFMFSMSVGVKESNEAEVMATLEALWYFSLSYRIKLMVEGDSANAVKWASHFDSKQEVERVSPWVGYVM